MIMGQRRLLTFLHLGLWIIAGIVDYSCVTRKDPKVYTPHHAPNQEAFIRLQNLRCSEPLCFEAMLVVPHNRESTALT